LVQILYDICAELGLSQGWVQVGRDAAGQSGTRRWVLAEALIDGTGAPPRPNAAVAIVDGRIETVCDRAEAAIRPGESVDDVTGTLLPGLIDAHVHLVFDHGPDHALTRAVVERSSLPELTLRAVRNARQCLLAGVTTVRDCGDRGFVTVALRDAISEGLAIGPRILASGPPITTTAGHLHWCGGVADSFDEARRRVRERCEAGVDWVKVMASGGNMTAGSNPLEPQYTGDEMSAMVSDAHRLRRPVSAHSLNADSNRRAVAAGVDTIEHCAWATPDGADGYDPELVRTMAERGSWVCLTLAGIDRELLPTRHDAPESAFDKLAKLRDRHANIRRMIAAGVPVILASDAGVRYSRFEEFWQTLLCASLALDLSPIDCIHRATALPATALGIPDLGVIAPGRRADLLKVAGDLSTDFTALSRVVAVWKDGREVVRDGMLRPPA
jgi:imidazolonepropionase-like amidohydrolase